MHACIYLRPNEADQFSHSHACKAVLKIPVSIAVINAAPNIAIVGLERISVERAVNQTTAVVARVSLSLLSSHISRAT